MPVRAKRPAGTLCSACLLSAQCQVPDPKASSSRRLEVMESEERAAAESKLQVGVCGPERSQLLLPVSG